MRVRLRLADTGDRCAIVAADGGEEIGWIDFTVDDGALNVRWVELAVERRRHGYGQEAVRLLEAEAARRWSVRSFRAEVPVETGLALYFWLRLGYRPLVPTAAGVMPMVREAARAA